MRVDLVLGASAALFVWSCGSSVVCGPGTHEENGLCLAGSGGSGGVPDVDLNVTAPSPASLLSACPTPGFTDLEATLRIGGHNDDCPLTVNGTTLEASGTCYGINIGLFRPVLLTLFSTPPASLQRAQISYHVGYVDLANPNVVTAGTTSVQVQLVNDGTSGKVFWHPSHLDAIPAIGTEQNDLDRAMQWAQDSMFNDVQPLLDRDGDGCANFVEACDGVLYDDTDIYSPGPPPIGTCSTPDP